LSNGSVQCILQDSEGYIWIGTQDGLNKFDGYTFTVFRFKEDDTLTLSDSFILSLTEDALGNLWVGTRNGLNSLNKQSGKIKRYYESGKEKHLFQNPYTSLSTDWLNRIWFEHEGHGLYYNPSTKMIEKAPLPDSLVVIPVSDKDKKIWLCSLTGEIFRVDSNMKLTKLDFPMAEKKAIAGLVCASIDGKGIMWLAEGNEIQLFNTHTGRLLHNRISLPNPILNLSHDNQGNTWISSSEGLYRINNYTWEHITNNESDHKSIPPGAVKCTYEDRDGNLWVGTGTVGISIYIPEQSKFKILHSSIYNDAVWSVYQDRNDILWVGTSSVLLRYKLKNPSLSSEVNPEKDISQQRKIRLMPNVKTNIFSLTQDQEGNIWAGTSGYGIFILNEGGNILHLRGTKRIV